MKLRTNAGRCEASHDFAQSLLEDVLRTTTDIGEEEDDDIDSCSTFSLQACIDEFRARRIRRNSSHNFEQRDDQQQQHCQHCGSSTKMEGLEDADLIYQNRSNKEHERKYKPCKNGFCYCFTSDSGDGGGGCFGATSVHTARSSNPIRPSKRNRKSESAQHTWGGTKHVHSSKKAKERRSAPACLKSNVPSLGLDASSLKKHKDTNVLKGTSNIKKPLTAVSRLETTSNDAPLIHIIQELRNNCVVSEVRVNKQKLKEKRLASKSCVDFLEKPKLSPPSAETFKEHRQQPTAPVMEEEIALSDGIAKSQSSQLNLSPAPGKSMTVSRLEIKKKSPRKKSGAGQLLQKRLSQSNIRIEPWNKIEPPPKPPRASVGGSRNESSVSSLTSSTSPSVREAERVIDDFLIKNGVPVPIPVPIPIPKATNSQKRVEVPTRNDNKSKPFQMDTQRAHHLPTCPSLSDTERMIDTVKQQSYYGKNIQQPTKQPNVKDISLGWKEAKVSEMLNYDSNGNRKQFKSQSAQAEPQSLGWQIPPKLQLDTVDGEVRHNLAANLKTKDTPVKGQFDSNNRKPDQQITRRPNPKFGWRHLSPWVTIDTVQGGTGMRECPNRTSSFLKQSKKKILRLVTPKKNNKHDFIARKSLPPRNIGIQTSLQDLASYANSSTPQSPPGSYNSAVHANSSTPHQSSTTVSNNAQHSQSTNPSDSSHFDFTRKVSSPKKPSRTSQRKLSFPTGCGSTSSCFAQNSGPEMEISRHEVFPETHRQQQTLATRTYRSYQTDIDQDVTISKMGAILSTIRARLEASDEHAVRTFEEIERREQLQTGFDCPDSFGIRQRICGNRNSQNAYTRRGHIVREPIYSEIEEDSIHVTECAQFENKTGIGVSCSANGVKDIEMLYAKVKKTSKNKVPLGFQSPFVVQDSLERHKPQDTNYLPSLPEPPTSNVSYSSPPLDISVQYSDYDSPTPSLAHYQSLNNIRPMDHSSTPNHNTNLNKSDLSLQRNEIFVENLCRSELIVDDGNLERLENIDNFATNNADDNISYDAPQEFDSDVSGEKINDTASNSTSIVPRKFLTKFLPQNIDVCPKEAFLSNDYKATCNSCPVTPHKSNAKSKNRQIAHRQTNSQPNSLNNTMSTETGVLASFTLGHCKRLKKALQNSIRKGKNFVKSRHCHSSTFNLTQPIEEQQSSPEKVDQEDEEFSLDLDSLFLTVENIPVDEQIVRAVSVCRQLPQLEVTPEMVEAERLLLFNTLRQNSKKIARSKICNKNVEGEGCNRNFSIKSMKFPISLESNLYDFYNYYFTMTFEIDNQILSTQSTECRHGEVVFHDCNIEFNTFKCENDVVEPYILCNIFMLRLRKVTSTSNNAAKDKNNKNTFFTESSDVWPLCSTPVSSVSSSGGIASRFRRYASFKIDACIFKPFNFCENDSSESCKTFCLRSSSRIASASMSVHIKRKIVYSTIFIDANVLAYFPRKIHNSFLHVQDPFNQHSWNRRWCILNGLQLDIWADLNCMNDVPLLRLSLLSCKQPLPLTTCAEDLCPRMRSFCLQCSTIKNGTDAKTATVFFAAESENDLSQWLQCLNEALNFLNIWITE